MSLDRNLVKCGHCHLNHLNKQESNHGNVFVKFSELRLLVHLLVRRDSNKIMMFSKKGRLEPGLKRDPFVDVRMPVKQNVKPKRNKT